MSEDGSNRLGVLLRKEYIVIGLPRKADGKSHCFDAKAATFVGLHGRRPRLTTDSIRTPAGLLRRGGSSRHRLEYKNEAMIPPKNSTNFVAE